jgi:putative transferase (TIGR04331 family)
MAGEIVVNDQQKPYFLATTAIEKFWDTSKPMLFLSDGCLRYSQKASWEQLNYKVLSCPLQDRQKFKEAYSYVSGLYERILPLLAEILNSIHKTEHDKRFWRIILGPWLFHYVEILYERYISLKSAVNQYSDFETIVLSEQNFVTPKDLLGFISLSCDDPYNLQLYTRILTFLGKDFETNNLNITIKPVVNSSKTRLVKGVFDAVGRLAQRFVPIVIKNTHLPLDSELQLFLKTGCRIWSNRSGMTELPSLPVNEQDRLKFRELKLEDNEFEWLLIEMLPLDIPKSYVEGFEFISNRAAKLYSCKPKTIFGTNSWYFDEIFKLWAATCNENGTNLCGIQHGANYGIAETWPLETHELAITKRFYSWGWEKSDCIAKVVPMPATRLIKRKSIGADNQKDGILMATNCFPRYFYRFQDFLSYDNKQYFDWQQRFVDRLCPENRIRLRVRLYLMDYGCDCVQKWKDSYPELAIENWDIPFLTSLENCRLHVSDHLASTFIDGLVANKPTILFWNPETFQVKNRFQLYFDKLRHVGILYDNPEAAAAAVDSVYNDVETWWNDRHRQEIRKEFCDLFARTSPNALDQWADELKRMARENDKQ